MPTTRSMKNSEAQLPNVPVKRKADGRKVLGDLNGRSNNIKQTTDTNAMGTRKILSTRLNNKNVAAGAETIRNRRTGVLKDSTNTNSNVNHHIEKFTSTLKKTFGGHASGSSASGTLLTAKQQASSSGKGVSRMQKPKTKKYWHNHQDSFKTPIEQWRLDLKEEMIRKNVFYDYEETIKDNPNDSYEFSFGIFEYMKWREERFEIQPYLNPGSGSFQKEWNEEHRRQLMNWMVEFQEVQESTHETLYLAIRLCDFYFSRCKVKQSDLQLYAFTGFLLASKFEERWPPMFDDMIHLSEDAYNRDDFCRAEENMLRILKFDINIPISYRYLRRYARTIGMDMKSLTVSRFYLELTLLEYEFVCESQSLLAAASLWIAMNTLGFDVQSRQRLLPQQLGRNKELRKYWGDQLSFYSGYHEWEVVALARRIARVVRDTQSKLAYLEVDDSADEDADNSLDIRQGPYVCKMVYRKYASEVFFKVAKLPILSDKDFEKHLRRVNSDKIDFEAGSEPNSKRRSTGCTTKLSKMSLRSNTPNIPERIPSQGSVTSSVEAFEQNIAHTKAQTKAASASSEILKTNKNSIKSDSVNNNNIKKPLLQEAKKPIRISSTSSTTAYFDCKSEVTNSNVLANLPILRDDNDVKDKENKPKREVR